MTDLRFPSRLDRLTPEIVTALLAEEHPGVVAMQVKVIQSAHRGDGVASTADRVTLDLERLVTSVQDLETLQALA
jgi:hypothetical protein